MPVLGIVASQMSGHLTPPAVLAYDSIATTTVSTAVSTITFSSIPSTYTHLQIRYLARGGGSSGGGSNIIRVNSDSGANYSFHQIFAQGSTVSAYGYASLSNGYLPSFVPYTGTANVFSTGVVDILDYASTTKNKTIRALGGFETNSTGEITLISNGWYNSSTAITSLTFTVSGSGTFGQYSQFALYGIKGA